MLNLLILVGRGLALAFRGHHELVLENLALRQQLLAAKRAASRPRLVASDRLFWILLVRLWRNWRSALVLVQPDPWCDGIATGSSAGGPDGPRPDEPTVHQSRRRSAPSSAR